MEPKTFWISADGALRARHRVQLRAACMSRRLATWPLCNSLSLSLSLSTTYPFIHVGHSMHACTLCNSFADFPHLDSQSMPICQSSMDQKTRSAFSGPTTHGMPLACLDGCASVRACGRPKPIGGRVGESESERRRRRQRRSISSPDLAML